MELSKEELAAKLYKIQDENAELYAKVETLRIQKRKMEKAQAEGTHNEQLEQEFSTIKQQLAEKEAENSALKRKLNLLHQKQQELLYQIEQESLYIMKELSPQVKKEKEELKVFDDQLISLCKELKLDTTELEALFATVQQKRELVSHLRDKCEQTTRLIEYQKRRSASSKPETSYENFENPLPCLVPRFKTRARMNSARHKLSME